MRCVSEEVAFHVVHAGVADLPAGGGQMIVVMGHWWQGMSSVAVELLWCGDSECGLCFLVGTGALSNTSSLTPVQRHGMGKCGAGSHRGNLIRLAEEAKVLHAIGATYIITASLFCLQSPLGRKQD